MFVGIKKTCAIPNMMHKVKLRFAAIMMFCAIIIIIIFFFMHKISEYIKYLRSNNYLKINFSDIPMKSF